MLPPLYCRGPLRPTQALTWCEHGRQTSHWLTPDGYMPDSSVPIPGPVMKPSESSTETGAAPTEKAPATPTPTTTAITGSTKSTPSTLPRWEAL